MKIIKLLCLFMFIGFLQKNCAGGKKKTIYTYRTESWIESDYIGAGFHLSADKIRPNIWVEVHKVDGEISDGIGLPNDSMSGGGVNAAFWASRDYEPLIPYTRIDYSKSLCALNPDGTASSTSGCRYYGDWINNAELWYDSSPYPGNADFRDKDGRSFLHLREDMHGERATRYRFIINIQDNTPLWFKDPAGGYNLAQAASAVEYFPLKKVVFRLTDYSSPPGGSIADAPLPASDDEDIAKDEYYIIRQGEDFKLDTILPAHRMRWGRFVYNFTEYHSFQQEKTYLIQVTAEDMEGNRRTLRVPIHIGTLSGLQIQHKAIQNQRN
jgi:hypothetical protein